MTRPHLHDFRGGESAWCTFPGCRATAHPNGCTCGLDVENPNVIAEADLGCPMHGLQEDFKYQIPLADAVQHAIAVLKVMGLDDNLDNRSHMTALVQAMLLYEERKATTRPSQFGWATTSTAAGTGMELIVSIEVIPGTLYVMAELYPDVEESALICHPDDEQQVRDMMAQLGEYYDLPEFVANFKRLVHHE